MADSAEVQARRKAVDSARANRSVLDSPLQKAGQSVFDLLYGDGTTDVADLGAGPLGMGVAGPLRPGVQAARDAVIRLLKPIRAYHGSPYSFDQFKLNPGAGQGASSFGEGLYFAESKPVGEKYARDLTSGPLFNQLADRGDPAVWPMAEALEYFSVDPTPPGVAEVRNFLSERFAALKDSPKAAFQRGRIQEAIRTLDADPTYLDRLREAVPNIAKPQGHRYEVNLHVAPNELLNWDVPLKQQPAAVRRALYGEGMPAGDIRRMADQMTGDEAYSKMAKLRGGDATTASRALSERGVAGVKYLDGFSRGSGAGTSNYVIFDPARVEILKKYGLAGAAGTAGLGELLYGDPTGRNRGTVTPIR